MLPSGQGQLDQARARHQHRAHHHVIPYPGVAREREASGEDPSIVITGEDAARPQHRVLGRR